MSQRTINMAGHPLSRWQSWCQFHTCATFHLDPRVSRCLCGASAFILKQSQWAVSSSVRGEAKAMRSQNDSCVNVVGGGRNERRS